MPNETIPDTEKKKKIFTKAKPMAFWYSASFEQTEVTTPKEAKLESYLGNFQEKKKLPLFIIYSGKHFAEIYKEKLYTEPWELLHISREPSNPDKSSIHRS